MGITAAIAAAVGTGYSIYAGERAASRQQEASAQAAKNAQQTADQADQAMNRANQKKPNVAGMLSANQQSAKSGVSGTMLTGPSGVNPVDLTLGKNTLLGG